MNVFVKSAMVAAALVTLPAAHAQAATLVVDVTGVDSVGEFGDPGNTVQTYNIGAGSRITGISYTVTLTAFDPSWLSEVALAFTQSNGITGVFFTPGFADADPGTATYSDTADLVALGLDFAVGADGILRLEYFEDFDDGSVNPDGRWDSGSITFTYEAVAGPGVPEPATWAMMIGGFGMAGAAMRRRRKVSVTYA